MSDFPSVWIPDEFGNLAVCDLGMLIDALIDEEPLDEAINNSAFDQIDTYQLTNEQLRNHVQRLRSLNETGNAEAYWGSE